MSNTDFFQIAALKVFAELGQLIEEDERNQITILDLPTDILHNQISKYLLKDKSIDKIFNKKDDYYLLNFLCGKIWDVKYIEPNVWNEYKTNINLDCIKNYVNTKFDCNKLIVKYQVNNNIIYNAFMIKMYNNETELGNISSECQIKHKNKKEYFLINKECQNTMEILKDEIKAYVKNYKENYNKN